ncbi:MAG TPA: hypothetical protein VGI76_01840 [Solirubrobacteraceae bacterium]|jgi:hypothetical protein
MKANIMSARRTSVVAAAVVLTLAVAWLSKTASAKAQFGIAAFDQQIASASGGAFTQAGGHPYAIVTEIDFKSHFNEAAGQLAPDADVKDVITELPPGLIGNPAGLPQCTQQQLTGLSAGLVAEAFKAPECPISSQVGTVALRSPDYVPAPTSPTFVFPLYNMVPAAGMPATFGFLVAGVPIELSGHLRNGGDFGVDIGSTNIPIAVPIDGSTITFWGVPADKSHDFQRCDWGGFGFVATENLEEQPACPLGYGSEYPNSGPHADPVHPSAFLTLPVSCTPPGIGLKTTLKADPWAEPGVFSESVLFSHSSPGYPIAEAEWGPQEGIDGCDLVPFKPSLTVEPTNSQADTPTGLNIDIALPQEGLSNPGGIATSDVKDAVVTLPAGESVSPSAADGLGGCSLEQIGLHTGLPAQCPDSSKLGTVQIDTPLLNEPLSGAIYLGKPECGPCGVADDLAGRLVKLYIVVEGQGVILKLPGRVELDPVTGRIVTTFDDNPQLPFNHLKLNFKAGPRSPLVNPHTCGTYQTIAVLTPWSGNPPAEIASSFQVTSGPNGSPCPSEPQAFAPVFAAGTTNNQAGAFSPLTVTFNRTDGEQQLGGVTVKTPPGLLGMLSSVTLCGEPEAAGGSCPSSSQIGSLTVAAGAGANPFYVQGGKVFLTHAYKGGEFGLSIVVPAQAGPFDLGTVVVRGSIAVDPVTTALTVTTDPLPTILDGIPLDLRTVNVRIDRPGFIFNPTNCDPMSLIGALGGGLGGSEEAIAHFQVTNCGNLGFAPKFAVTTTGKTSRSGGAGLTVRLTYPKGAQANIAKVRVSLPKQLPSRLTTLQKACPDSIFNSNPSNCPAASRIGTAKAITPVIPEPLTGPVFFVSHGGQAFPDLVVVLQGYGVTVDLVGNTHISKTGITSTSFEQVPDVPVGSFELNLPQGPYSALAANGNLCKAKLRMPTAFIAQDGQELRQATPIAATDCTKHKARHNVRYKHTHHSKHRKK